MDTMTLPHRLVRRESRQCFDPFAFMTGLADNAGMRHGMELGADDYLPKPFTIDALPADGHGAWKKFRQCVRKRKRNWLICAITSV